MMHHSNQENPDIGQSDHHVRDIVAVLGKTYVLDILEAAIGEEPSSAKQVARNADVPTTTLYRRLDELVDEGLIEETMRLDDDGDHYHVYETSLDHLRIAAEVDGLAVDIEVTDDEERQMTDDEELRETGGRDVLQQSA